MLKGKALHRQEAAEEKHGAASIRALLRQQIVDGLLPPGAKLPPHLVLAEQYRVSNVTIQNALNQLAGDGFIEIRARVGSFVVEHPPHLTTLGLIFRFDPTEREENRDWSKYYQALTMAAAQIQEETGRPILAFHGIGKSEENRDYKRLLQDIDRQRLCGLIFVNSPYDLEKTPVVQAPGVPRVELSSRKNAPWPTLRFDQTEWMNKALDRLIERGCKRVAFLFHRFRGTETYLFPRLDRQLAARGLDAPVCWRQAHDWRDVTAVNHSVQLLMRGKPTDRPDGLVVADDNHIEGVVAGLVAAGVRVPDDLAVVANANFPLAARPVLPFELLGHDLDSLLRQAIDLLDRQRQEGPLQETMKLNARWQEDLSERLFTD